MKRRILGRTGISVSEFALGTMMFGALANTDHEESIRMIHTALEASINFDEIVPPGPRLNDNDIYNVPSALTDTHLLRR
jgi:hypothetical protein